MEKCVPEGSVLKKTGVDGRVPREHHGNCGVIIGARFRKGQGCREESAEVAWSMGLVALAEVGQPAGARWRWEDH